MSQRCLLNDPVLLQHKRLIFKGDATNLTGGNFWITYMLIIWLSGIASPFVDNIPFTATMIPLIQTINIYPNIALTVKEFQFSPL
jgi:hypothetical protein